MKGPGGQPGGPQGPPNPNMLAAAVAAAAAAAQQQQQDDSRSNDSRSPASAQVCDVTGDQSGILIIFLGLLPQEE